MLINTIKAIFIRESDYAGKMDTRLPETGAWADHRIAGCVSARHGEESGTSTRKNSRFRDSTAGWVRTGRRADDTCGADACRTGSCTGRPGSGGRDGSAGNRAAADTGDGRRSG